MKKTLFIFDLDDTLVQTTARVHMKSRDLEQTLSSVDFNRLPEEMFGPGMSWDFSEFNSLEKLRSEQTLEAFDIWKCIHPDFWHIITTRADQNMIFDWAREHSSLSLKSHIHTWGKVGNGAQFKADTLRNILEWEPEWDEVFIYEDNPTYAGAMVAECVKRGYEVHVNCYDKNYLQF